MTPALNGIDHVHVYVPDWDGAEGWYRSIPGPSCETSELLGQTVSDQASE
jgi:hypothetical protein